MKMYEREICRRARFAHKRETVLAKAARMGEVDNTVRKLFKWGDELQKVYGETEFIDELVQLVWETMGEP